MLFYLVGGLLSVGVAGQCATGTPLVGRLGAPLFCGVGERSVTCPSGSVCLLPAGLCCPSAVVATQPVVVTIPIVPPPLVVAKCQFGSPWKNALGVEFDCGPGPNHADCPAGSQCITGPNGVFHACCAISATSVPPAPPAPPAPITPIAPAAPPATTLPPIRPQVLLQPTLSNTQLTNTQLTLEQRELILQESNATEDSEDNSTMTVRFLNIQIIDRSDVIVMWAPPEGEEKPASYLAEFSYDGQNWKELELEEPDATFVEFPLEEQKSFQVRVTPEGGSPALQSWQFRQGKGGKSGKMGKMGN